MTAGSALLGRDAEFASIREAVLTNPGPVLVAGKAVLGSASVCQHLLLDESVATHFGARRYWVDAADARADGELLAAMASAIGVSGGSALKGRVFEHLADGPALLVLHGVHVGPGSDPLSLDELATRLAHIPTLSWVVTSSRPRESFSIRWRTMVRLEPLTIEKAKRAFVAVAGSSTASDPLLDSIVTASACVPVALELLALDVRNSGGVASVWERLQRVVVGSPRESGDETDVAVDRALAAVVEHLAIEARRLLAVAAMFRDGIAVSDVGMLEGIDESTVSQLATAGVTSPPVQRCAVVAALIEPVKRIVPAATADVARLYAFYLRQVDELSPLAGQPFGDQAVEKLTRELRNIEASLSTCLRQGSIAAARAALKYGNYVRHSGLGDPTILDRARDVADAHGDTQLKAQSASCRADIALSAFDHRLARTRYEEARQDYHTIKEAAGESHCLRNIGVIALRTQHWSAARACFEQSLALSRTAGDRVGEASAIERLGDLALAQDQFEAAREHFQEALVRYHELGDASEADCWLSLGQIAAHAHDIDHAREFFEKALALHRSAGHQLGVANSLLLRAELDVKQAPVQAERDLREALGGYRRVGNVRGEANARLLLAEIAAAQNARDKASALFRAALLLFQSADDPAGEATVFGRLADVAAEEGRSEDARAYREEADALIARLRS